MNQAVTARVIDFLCANHMERDLVGRICGTDDVTSLDFWQATYGHLAAASATMGFEYYDTVARCHTLCVAVAPDRCDTWAAIVLEHLHQSQSHMDAFTAGSIIGLFEAGCWLQEKHESSVHGCFLQKMGYFAVQLMRRQPTLVNASGSQDSGAQLRLKQAVTRYLRPRSPAVMNELVRDIRAMLETIYRELDHARNAPVGRSPAGAWLLDSLVQGALNIQGRNPQELVTAALALYP